jgi:hypothetical protein
MDVHIAFANGVHNPMIEYCDVLTVCYCSVFVMSNR